MEAATTAISILSISLAKRLGKDALATVFSDEKSVTRTVLESALSDSGGKLTDSLKRVLDGLPLTRKVRREIEENPTIFDLAGIAWGQALGAQNDADLGHIPRSPDDLRRVLSPRWFVQTLMGLSGQEPGLGFEAGAMNPREKPPEALIEQIAQQTSAAVLDEFGIPGAPDALVLTLLRELVAQLPARIEALFLALPGVNDVLARVAAEAARDEAQRSRESAEATQRTLGHLVGHFDGSFLAQQALRAMKLFAAKTAAFLDRDVFGRTTASADEFALLPLGETYVEPNCKPRGGTEQPVLEYLRTELLAASNGLVALLAPFGFGKSLTVRMLAARLAHDWLCDPTNAPLPVFVHAPELLSSHARSPEDALRSHLERTMGLDPGVVSWIWQNVSIVVLLDSFDEVVFDGREARSWITMLHQFARAGRHRVLVASRDHALELKWLGAEDRILHIQAFAPDQIGAWLERTRGKVHDGSLTAPQVIEWLGDDLAGTPILFLMAAWDWHSAEANRLLKKSELYSRFIARISRGKWKGIQEAHQVVEEGAKHLDTLQDGDVYQKALARIAWAHLVNETRQREPDSSYVLPVAEVETILRREFRVHDGAGLQGEQIRAIYKCIVLSVFFRRAEDDEGIRFAHKSFREYLCAKHIVTCLCCRQDPHRTPHFHPGIAALAQIRLPSEELAFAADLLRDAGETARKNAMGVLESIIETPKCVLLMSLGAVQIHSEAHGDQVIEFDPNLLSHAQNGFANAESLALLTKGRRRIMHAGFRQALATVTDGEFRVIENWHGGLKTAYHRQEDDDRLWVIIAKDHRYWIELLPGHITRPDGSVAVPLPPDAVKLSSKWFIEHESSPTLDNMLTIGRKLHSLAINGWWFAGRTPFTWTEDGASRVWPLYQAPAEPGFESNLGNFWCRITSRWLVENVLYRLKIHDIYADPIATKTLLIINLGGRISNATFSDALMGFEHFLERYIIGPQLELDEIIFTSE